MSRRQRVRASDLASPKPYKSLGTLFFICIGLALIFTYKFTMGDSAVGLLGALGIDPQLQLPKSVLDRSPEGTISTAQMLQYRQENLASVLRCAQPGVVGQYGLNLLVNAGTVISATAYYDDLEDPGVGQCIKDQAMRWPALPIKGDARVYIPINFSPRRAKN